MQTIGQLRTWQTSCSHHTNCTLWTISIKITPQSTKGISSIISWSWAQLWPLLATSKKTRLRLRVERRTQFWFWKKLINLDLSISMKCSSTIRHRETAMAPIEIITGTSVSLTRMSLGRFIGRRHCRLSVGSRCLSVLGMMGTKLTQSWKESFNRSTTSRQASQATQAAACLNWPWKTKARMSLSAYRALTKTISIHLRCPWHTKPASHAHNSTKTPTVTNLLPLEPLIN